MSTQTLTQRSSKANQSASQSPVTVPMRADGRGFPRLTAPTPGAKLYTWEEVAKHTSVDSCWVYAGNKVYDITDWLDRHPGGRDILLLSAGRDITDLLVSYHPFSDKPQQVLSKYEIGEVSTTEFPQYEPDSGFYAELRKEVGDYFKKNQFDPKNPVPGLTRLAGMMLVAAITYYCITVLSADLSFAFRFVCAVIFGVCQALPLLHCMHDASHLAIGSTPSWWYYIGRLTMDWFAGASINSWHHQHILGHHVYTNVMGVDPDLPMVKEGDLRRVSKWQKWSKMYKFQHIYLSVLYGLLAIKFRIQDIVGTMQGADNGMVRMNEQSLTEQAGQVTSKICWFIWRFVLPVYYGYINSLTEFIILSIVIECVTGYYLTFNFQVSHVSPVADFPEYEKPQFTYEWAPSQLLSTVDYAHDSPVATFLCGALNYQSIHHLFPCVSQYYYPALAPIVQKVAKKFGIRYNYVGSFTQALKLHMQHLQTMGVSDMHHH